MAKTLNDLKILVVEDNKSVLKMMKAVFRSIGLRHVYTEEDGMAAYEFLCHNPDLIELIVCDSNMSRPTGIEFLKKVRILYTDMPFMMVTGDKDILPFVEANELEISLMHQLPAGPTCCR